MSIGLIGKKSGMSRLFLEDGESIPVTAISVCGNFVADIKTKERNGKSAEIILRVNFINWLQIMKTINDRSPSDLVSKISWVLEPKLSENHVVT